MSNLKPYRTTAQKAEARRTARKDQDGAWRSNAPFSIHGQPGEWAWDASHKAPVRKSEQDVDARVPSPRRRRDRGDEDA